MSLAIKFGDSSDKTSLSGAIYFDAVTQYDKQFRGKVTEHPIEAGASITDHFISENPKYSISGVISHIDFSLIPSQLKLDGDTVMNNQEPPASVVVSDMGSALSMFIPSVIEQFLPVTRPSVVVDPSERLDSKMSIENFFEVLMKGLFYNEKRKKWENRMTPCTLYELKGVTPVRPIQNLILTSVSENEDEDSGDALFLDLTFEQVTFITLDKVDAPKAETKSDTEKKTSDKKSKGNQNSTVNDPKTPPSERATVESEMSKGNSTLF